MSKIEAKCLLHFFPSLLPEALIPRSPHMGEVEDNRKKKKKTGWGFEVNPVAPKINREITDVCGFYHPNAREITLTMVIPIV